MQTVAGPGGQPPRKRLKTGKTLFDFGIKRGREGQHELRGCTADVTPFRTTEAHDAGSLGPVRGHGGLLLNSRSTASELSVTERSAPSQEPFLPKVGEGDFPNLVWQRQAFDAFKQAVKNCSLTNGQASSRMASSGSIEAGTPVKHTMSSLGNGNLMTCHPSKVLRSERQQSVLPSESTRSKAKKVPNVPGLRYSLNFISRDEERYIVDLLDSGRFQWRTDIARRTLHFGESSTAHISELRLNFNQMTT
jgi:hypothetical protein